jgi:hypothetical protein
MVGSAKFVVLPRAQKILGMPLFTYDNMQLHQVLCCNNQVIGVMHHANPNSGHALLNSGHGQRYINCVARYR